MAIAGFFKSRIKALRCDREFIGTKNGHKNGAPQMRPPDAALRGHILNFIRYTVRPYNIRSDRVPYKIYSNFLFSLDRVPYNPKLYK